MLGPALAVIGFRRATAYRAATLAGLVTNLFFGLLRAYIFIALYRGTSQTEIGGYDLARAVTFSALTQALIAPLSVFGWWDLMRSIRSGDVAADLTRPIDLYGYYYARDVGAAVWALGARGAPIVLAYPLFFDLVWPGDALTWAMVAVSVVLAHAISFAWRFAVNATAFWTLDAYGMARIAFMAVLLLSGFIVPVRFYPDWARGLLSLTPFPAMINTPIEIWVGVVRGPEAWRALAVQAWWAAALALGARALCARGVARLVVQGG